LTSSSQEKSSEHENKTYVEANNAVVVAQDVLYANGAFITEELYNKYDEILKLCGHQLNAFQRRFSNEIVILSPCTGSGTPCRQLR